MVSYCLHFPLVCISLMQTLVCISLMTTDAELSSMCLFHLHILFCKVFKFILPIFLLGCFLYYLVERILFFKMYSGGCLGGSVI